MILLSSTRQKIRRVCVSEIELAHRLQRGLLVLHAPPSEFGGFDFEGTPIRRARRNAILQCILHVEA